jgi:excinuclease ABC subunit C
MGGVMDIPEKVREKLRALPNKPGCYMMRDRAGTIIYVGKAISLRKRVQSYFREAALRSGSPKLRGLVRHVADIDHIVVHNEAAAILTEGKLIKQYKPRYNVSFRDDKRFLMIRGNVAEPLPRLKTVRIRREDGARYFGPYVSAQAARAAIDFVEKRYGLRKCGPRLPNADTYKHCLNDILRFCSAPCIDKISDEQYRAQFDEACEFLRGRRPEVLKELRKEMDVAAAALDYERAAALRDTLFLLQRAVRQHARVQPTPRMQADAALQGLGELRDALGLATPPHVIECFDISNISGTHAVASMVCAVDGQPRNNRYRRYRIKTVEGSDDPAMMAEAIRRRYGRLKDEGAAFPDLIIVDGGVTQLRAARAALAELGLGDLETAGLAKQFEELHRDNGRAPVRLPRDSQGLYVVTRLRDEAHRFAIGYHRTLRQRRLRESALDEIEGIGPKRKLELLRHFGSVRRLLKATPEDIATVPGIGASMAEQIWRSLSELSGKAP